MTKKKKRACDGSNHEKLELLDRAVVVPTCRPMIYM
jgi:hypothetical protein